MKKIIMGILYISTKYEYYFFPCVFIDFFKLERFQFSYFHYCVGTCSRIIVVILYLYFIIS